jgi:hypothetical protein
MQNRFCSRRPSFAANCISKPVQRSALQTENTRLLRDYASVFTGYVDSVNPGALISGKVLTFGARLHYKAQLI